ncbi:alpha/beta fold hydrolase [Xenophilus sp. Marseille-Q4582]|uniref:alpha/beta fold hydrolase n=1 Tax=Xenophilus sp. Marseille-Q4582 TaxID=2866600 RepID=UPI001CE49D8A|nr:alpha/beta hydrolase [Xenophilus sp. Marseille-Q4582]
MTATPPTDRWIEHAQGRLFARRWQGSDAQAAPLLLFHDSLGAVELWRDFPAALAEATGRSVVAYDRLGFGRSDARSGLPPLDFVVDESRSYLDALLTQLGITRFVALGHSVGGGMAIETAVQRPEACEALIVIAAQIFPEAHTLDGIRAAAPHVRSPEQVQKLARYHGDKAEWVLSAWIDRWLDPAFATWTLKARLPQVRCPMLALYGSKDEYCSAMHGQLIWQQTAGRATVQTLDGLGHVPHREDLGQVTGLIADFLRISLSPPHTDSRVTTR